ncbi:MAG: 2-oxoglutarate synthase [Desulfobacteraceae bacterium]|nr:2-oxoglutarate synthase [Desulfobacteraceae bacterium]
MTSLLNKTRPPVFCPGCSHERVTYALDKTLGSMGLDGNQVAIVSDIGCSGLFDTFFNTHAFHGLHGRALTYATGIKMARPDLKVIVTMGDGGLGIGGAHLLSTCRRNIDLTLLILNNFNYGMTGGQFSSTTPNDAQVDSGFLNQLEKPADACQVAASAGAGYVSRISAYTSDLSEEIEKAIRFEGFSVVDMWGMCPGRYTKRNKLTQEIINKSLSKLPPMQGPVPENARKEYSIHYKEVAETQPPVLQPASIEAKFSPPESGRQEVIIMGSAGQRIVTAGEILCLAGLSAGLNATQKNDYPITVLRGHSVSEVVISEKEIGFTGIDAPAVVIALAPEGVARQKKMLAKLDKNTLVIQAKGVELPVCNAEIREMDFKSQKIKSSDQALASLAVLAELGKVVSPEMLKSALEIRFKDKILASAVDLVDRTEV